jgi:hypothetical protein
MSEMHTENPKTINEALKILAYNDYFWHRGPKTPNTLIKPHIKDFETVKSLAEAQYPWTEKQAKLALVILKRYLTKFQKHGMEIKDLLNSPKYDEPFRVINFDKIIEKYIDDTDEEPKIELRFPYNKKLVTLIRILKDKRDLPGGYAQYDGEVKKWTFKQTDVTTYYLTLIAIRYDFKFVDQTLLDDYYTVRKEIENYKQPKARLVGGQIIIDNASESLNEYWDNNLKDKKTLIQIDSLKNFGIDTKGIKFKSWSELGGKMAHANYHKLWIDRNEYNRDQVLAGLLELDCFPIVIPVSGDPNSIEDANDWSQWLKTFERHGIENKNLSFGFDIKEPKKANEVDCEYNDNVVGKMEESKFQILYEVYQLSKQFKYIDKETKVIFVRNRIPRTLMKSKIKPKASLVALGGGYYTAGTDNLKRFLDSLPKTLYYNDHRPSSWEWHDNIIIKL